MTDYPSYRTGLLPYPVNSHSIAVCDMQIIAAPTHPVDGARRHHDDRSVWKEQAMAAWLDIWGPADEVIAGGPAIFATQRGTGDIWQYAGELDDWKQIGGPGFMFAVSFSYEKG